MDDYSYEIVKYVPEARWIKVAYSREGDADYIKMMTLDSFDEANIQEQIEGFAPVVFDHWDKLRQAPAELNLSGKKAAKVVRPKHVVHETIDPLTVDYDNFYTETETIETDDSITYREVLVPLSREQKEFRIRTERDMRLNQTAWMVLPDSSTPTQAQLNYRQALRDVTKQSGFPDNVVWPVFPATTGEEVPASVSPRQARLALAAQGLLSQVEASIAAMPDDVRETVQIEWEYATEVARDSVLTSSLGGQLGLDEGELDALFKVAVTL